ncbi:hypothetical protein GUITHDRAFT_139391 [Guillardia theta CCMP2712]|uniref:Fatty acid hydroxylase domain-containing protein n=1 Tax=Guillardia theta (strain CCMP2712) TaxID=905079 RepID=L1J9K7_GUITC|nr:hypothetical protein GUITHDRAFT_139391 [Guillardia theta CCMP2712]EKX44755.1 hypothetical protein GUITHDRAFT_139391 [Guillardia theta CCMP2712]|eukprot:XP_005831735.1 hypothetical protein GUITHDRAFT_139391 [Guillardia theta CCMP2712]
MVISNATLSLRELIQDIWNYLKEMSIVKNETFEPLVASIAFAVWVAMFRLIDRSQQWRKFKIIDEEMRERYKTLLLSQVFLGIFVYDFLFFWIHLSMHKLKYLGFLGHAVHHRKHPLEATQVVNHSFADGFLQVMTNIITLHLVRSHPMVVITYTFSPPLQSLSCPVLTFPGCFIGLFPWGFLEGHQLMRSEWENTIRKEKGKE